MIWDASTRCADLRYATSLWVADPVIWIDRGDETVMLVRDLEVERAERDADVTRVLPLSAYDDAKEVPEGVPRSVRAAVAFLLRSGVRAVEMHPDTPARVVEALRKAPLAVEVAAAPFFPQRARKSQREIDAIIRSESAAERAIGIAEGLLWDARREGGVLTLEGQPLTSERVRREMGMALFAEGYFLERAIVSCGREAAVPHEPGSGPLRSDVPIVVDVFPRSLSTGYYGDLTRTFVKGTPTPGVVRMYDAVRAAHGAAIQRVGPGTPIRDIHAAVEEIFASRGFATTVEPGRAEGFIHGTGHGVGLEIHEAPSIGRVEDDSRLEAGHVVTIEPGLYYHDEGGVRLEDLVIVTPQGCETVSTFLRDLIVIP